MPFPDEEAKLKSGRIGMVERLHILETLGKYTQEKYDEYLTQGASTYGYDLEKLKGSLKFVPDIGTFENSYYLQGKDEHWTDIANYFEYGTGLFNSKRAGKYRAGYIRPVIKEYMKFVAKDGRSVITGQVKGVHPIFAMTKAIKYIEFNRGILQRGIRLELAQNGN